MNKEQALRKAIDKVLAENFIDVPYRLVVVTPETQYRVVLSTDDVPTRTYEFIRGLVIGLQIQLPLSDTINLEEMKKEISQYELQAARSHYLYHRMIVDSIVKSDDLTLNDCNNLRASLIRMKLEVEKLEGKEEKDG